MSKGFAVTAGKNNFKIVLNKKNFVESVTYLSVLNVSS